eukprot:scaffold209860_cov13-Tisochrysis_lutea.AAC.1
MCRGPIYVPLADTTQGLNMSLRQNAWTQRRKQRTECTGLLCSQAYYVRIAASGGHRNANKKWHFG